MASARTTAESAALFRSWMRRRVTDVADSIRRWPASASAKKWARNTAIGIGGFTLFAGAMHYSETLRRHVAPRVLPVWAFRTNYVQHHRKRTLFASLHGRVLELGPGVGANFPYFSHTIQYVGVEPNPELLPQLYDSAAEAGIPPATLDVQSANIYEYLRRQPTNSLDSVVSSFVLCTLPEYRDVVGEVHRVLKPGGRFYFIEPVARESGTVARIAQSLLNPIYRTLSGTNLTHSTDAAIAAVGFERVATEWWTWNSEWKAANKHAAALNKARRDGNSGVVDRASLPSPNNPDAVSATAVGTRPVIAGIAVKANAPAPAAPSVGGFFNYGLFRS